MGNILKNTVECTCEEFVAEVAGRRRKPYLDALKSTFKAIVLGKSTLVKEMSSFLRENEGKLERKRVQELMSGWLNAYDFAALLNPYLLARSAADVTDEATLAVDFSDISKEFGGDGMEGMEMTDRATARRWGMTSSPSRSSARRTARRSPSTRSSAGVGIAMPTSSTGRSGR